MKKHVLGFIRRGSSIAWIGPLVLAVIYLILQKTRGIAALTVNEVAIGIISISALAFIAGGMNASRLITMTDIEGILMDKDDHSSIIPCIDLKMADKLFKHEIISGGMIPKVECCIDAIHKGVKKVTILDGRVPHALLIEMLTDEGAGTMFVRDMDEDKDEL